MKTVMSKEVDTVQEGDLRLWYLHQVGSGNDILRKKVKSIDEALLLLPTIYELMLFLEEASYIPDFCNAGGLEVAELDENGGIEWREWINEAGLDISEIMAMDMDSTKI